MEERRERTCLVCDDAKYADHFPSTKEVSSHHHGANVCRDCYLSHVKVEIDSKQWDEIACPECTATLSCEEVKSMTSTGSFVKYERACIMATLSVDPEFRHCLSTACSSGQLHPAGTDEPIFRCEECGHRHCVVCETNWHQDQTCEEFQATHQRRLDVEDEISQREIAKISKPCPQCGVRIEKRSGCDHMTCSRCTYEFCWICSATYSDIFREGDHRHEETCIHYSAAPRPELIEAERRRLEETRRIDEENRRRELLRLRDEAVRRRVEEYVHTMRARSIRDEDFEAPRLGNVELEAQRFIPRSTAGTMPEPVAIAVAAPTLVPSESTQQNTEDALSIPQPRLTYPVDDKTKILWGISRPSQQFAHGTARSSVRPRLCCIPVTRPPSNVSDSCSARESETLFIDSIRIWNKDEAET